MTPYRDEYQALSVAHYVAGKVTCKGPGYVNMIGGTVGLKGWLQDVDWNQRMALATLTLKLVREKVSHDAWMILQLKFSADENERASALKYMYHTLDNQFEGKYPNAFLEVVALQWAQPCKLTAIRIEDWEQYTRLSERTIRYWIKAVRTALSLRFWQALEDAARVLSDAELIDG